MTSAVVSIIRQNSRTAAARPSARSSQTPASAGWDGDGIGPLPASIAGGEPLELCAELGEHLGAVDTLGSGVLDPLVVDRLGPLLHVLDELGRRRADVDPDPLHLLQRRGVGGIPGLAGEQRQRLARYRHDGVLILL